MDFLNGISGHNNIINRKVMKVDSYWARGGGRYIMKMVWIMTCLNQLFKWNPWPLKPRYRLHLSITLICALYKFYVYLWDFLPLKHRYRPFYHYHMCFKFGFMSICGLLYIIGRSQKLLQGLFNDKGLKYDWIEFMNETPDHENLGIDPSITRICMCTCVKSTPSRHAVTYDLEALAHGWYKNLRKCALPCGCLMNIHKISWIFMRQPQESAHLRTVFDQPYASAAKPSVTACLLAVGLIRVNL